MKKRKGFGQLIITFAFAYWLIFLCLSKWSGNIFKIAAISLLKYFIEDLFVGFVTDVNLTYPDGSNSFADFIASDAFIKIANTEIVNQAFSSATSGTMIGAVLDNTDVKFSASARDIETGISTMQAFSDLSGNTLSILQQMEFELIFMMGL